VPQDPRAAEQAVRVSDPAHFADQKDDFITGMDAGADDYLIKPFDPRELQARLRAGERVLDLQAQQLLQNLRLEAAVRSERQAHEALKQAQAQLVQGEKMAALGQMVAGVAHEINNPLAFVIGSVAALERDMKALRQLLGLYQEGDEALGQVCPDLLGRVRALAGRIDLGYTLPNLDEQFARSREGLRRIQHIVGDLRDFARLDEGERQRADLNAGILSTINIIRGRARTKQVRIEKDLAPSLPDVWCYPAKINQVVMNLLANGIDATEPGGVVTIRTRPPAAAARLCRTPWRSWLRTPGRGSRPRCASVSSTRSSPPSRPVRARAWVCPSATASCATTAARSAWTPPTPPRVGAPVSSFACRYLSDDCASDEPFRVGNMPVTSLTSFRTRDP
jgi:hypothetical protein